MSVTYSIVCDDCKITCWVGQSGYIYGYKYIDDFLKKHMGHRLRYLCDLAIDDNNNPEVLDYEDCPESLGKKELL